MPCITGDGASLDALWRASHSPCAGNAGAGQLDLPLLLTKTTARSAATAFTAAPAVDESKPRFFCPAGDDTCYCAEGHRCVMSDTTGLGSGGQDFVEYKMGCPTDPQGLGTISEASYSKSNPLCVENRCICVLAQEPRPLHKEDQPEFIKVPTVDGEWRTLKHRYPMLKLTDKFVDAFRSHTQGNLKCEHRPIMLTAEQWKQYYPDIQKRMQRIMRSLHRKCMSVESTVEHMGSPGDPDPAHHPELGFAPTPPPGKHHMSRDEHIAESGASNAVGVINEMIRYQELCNGLQTTARKLGMANDGEGGLNCYQDYKEKKKLYDSMDLVMEVTTSIIPDNSKDFGKPDLGEGAFDEWTLGGLMTWLSIPSRCADESASCRQRIGDFFAPAELAQEKLSERRCWAKADAQF